MEKRDKIACITGITGMDGSTLTEGLLKDGYHVVGLVRRSSTYNNLDRLKGVINHPNLKLYTGDITDSACLYNMLAKEMPDEIYNLAAQSHVGLSYENPQYTFEVTAGGCLNILEAYRNVCPHARFYQAGSSEQFGTALNEFGYQDSYTEFRPVSPYAAAKVAAHHLTRMYRDSYNLHASVGILFNHSNSRRGDEFVCKKICKYVAGLILTNNRKAYPKLKLGNLDAQRDWGYANEYVEAMRLMVGAEYPDDYVIATGETHTVREFVELAFSYPREKWEDYVQIDESLKRPSEVPILLGDASKAQQKLGWKAKVKFHDLVELMLKSEIETHKKATKSS